MAEDRLKEVDMESTWSWFGELEEFNLGTHNGEFVDGAIIVKLINEQGQKVKVRMYIQDVEITEVIQPPNERDELLSLLDDIFGLLDGLADGAENTEDFDESERLWADARDRASRAYEIAKKLN